MSAAPLDRAEAEALAEEYLAEHGVELGLEPADVAGVIVTDAYVSSHTGTRHVYLRQTWQGIEVFAGNFTLNLAPEGEALHVGDRFYRQLSARIAPPAVPTLTAREAVERAAQHLELGSPTRLEVLEQLPDTPRTTVLSRGGLSKRPILAYLVWAEEPAGGALRLAWNLEIEPLAGVHYWSLRIDAESGVLLDLDDWVDWDEYRVYPLPVESPHHTTPLPPDDARTLEVDPVALSASPFGWHDDDGVAGAEYTFTGGNNVYAYEDTDGDDIAPATDVDCGASLSCDFPIDLNLAPGAYIPASITNLFYWNNIVHDLMYGYGFDAPAGNFQHDTYGNGGAGGDRVHAQGQDGGGNCNANFATPPDGSSPRMQMYTCDLATPARDGSFDDLVIVHEYAHGISNRLTGGPSNVSCLGNAEQMGEGWSDFYGLMLTQRPGDQEADARTVGTYLAGQSPGGPGLRPAPYSTDEAINDFTYADVGQQRIPHGVGFVWATMLWDLTWNLIAEHGFNTDVYGAWNTGGNNLALQLVTDGLKLQSCSPGFVDGRDAILAADQGLTGEANKCAIWTAFAKRGVGLSAEQGSVEIISDGEEAFDLPDDCETLSAVEDHLAICAGDDAVFALEVGGAYTPPVLMSVPDAPAGVTTTFSPNPVEGPLPEATALTVGSTGGLAFGVELFTANGSDGTLSDDLPLSLSVFTAAPSAPVLVWPADGATEVPLRPILRWEASTQGHEYLLEVDDDPGFGSPEVSEVVTLTRHAPNLALLSETTYYWRVQPANPCGAGTSSPVFSFETSDKLVASQPEGAAAFGTAVALRDDLVAVGAPFEDGPGGLADVGAVYLYGRNTGGADAWTLIQRFAPASPVGGERFGAAVAVATDTLVVGAPGDNGGEGKVELYERNAGGADAWKRVRTLTAPGSGLFGAALALDRDRLVAGAPGDDTSGEDSGRATMWRRFGGVWGFVSFLAPPSAPQTGDRYGSAVATSGSWAAVGAPFDAAAGDDAGRVHLFERNHGGADAWGHRTAVGPAEATPQSFHFGSALAMDLDTLLIGVPGDLSGGELGSVRVLAQNQGGADAWGQAQEIHAADDGDWGPDHRFGVAVAVHGDHALVGRADFGEGGAAYLFDNTATGTDPWVEIAAIGAPDGPSGGYGDAVAIDHGTLLVGSRFDDVDGQAGAGSAYLVHREPTGWEETTKVLGPAASYTLGGVTAISGGTMVAGNIGELPIVYRRDATGEWSAVATLQPVVNGGEILVDFGASAAIDGDHVVVGDPGFDYGNDGADGAAFVFQRNQGGPDAWGQAARLVPADQAFFHESQFGGSVAISGDLIAVGAPIHDRDSEDGLFREGAAFLFRRNEGGPDAWGQVGGDFNLHLDAGIYTDSSDRFGATVAVSGRHVLVAATRDEVDAGGAEEPGVGYLFEIIGNDAVLRSRLVGPDVQSLETLGWVSGLDGPDAFLTAANGDGIYLFERNTDGADAWGFSRKRCGSDGTSCHSGAAIDGGLILAGGTTDRVNVFARNEGGAGNWGHVLPLSVVPSDPGGFFDGFGNHQFNVGFDRGNAAVGAPGDGDNGTNAGAAYVFRLQGTWPTTPPIPPCSVGTSDLALADETILDTRVYEACETITAERFTVGSTGDVTFRAGSKIVLGDGFRVESDGSFVAEIDPTIQ